MTYKLFSFTSYNEGSCSLFFHLSKILIFADYFRLAMTKMKCSILGHVCMYVYILAQMCVYICVGSRKKKKYEWTSVCEILSLFFSFFLLFFFICIWMSIGSTMCIQVHIAQWTNEKRERKEGRKKERTNGRFRSQLVLCIKHRQSDCI